MATTKLTLFSGSGKRGEWSVWQGECPVCGKFTKFSYEFYDLEIIKAISGQVISFFSTAGMSFMSLIFSPSIQDIVGCSNCRHAMAICPNCQIAFSISKSANFYSCPSCNTTYA
jgi:hypothetical protein